MAGDPNIARRVGNSRIGDPVLVSNAQMRLESLVPKYTTPSRTAGELTTHDPWLSNDHFFSPVFVQRVKLRIPTPEIHDAISHGGRALDADLVMDVRILPSLELPLHTPSRGI